MTKESDSQDSPDLQGQSKPSESEPNPNGTKITGNKSENPQQQIAINPLDKTKSITDDINTLITPKNENSDNQIEITDDPKKLDITPAATQKSQEGQQNKDKDDIEQSIKAMYEIRNLVNEVLNFVTLGKSKEFQEKLEDKGKEKIQQFNEKLASFRDTIKDFITSKAEKKSVAGTKKEADPAAAATNKDQSFLENTSTSSSPENLAQQAKQLSKELKTLPATLSKVEQSPSQPTVANLGSGGGQQDKPAETISTKEGKGLDLLQAANIKSSSKLAALSKLLEVNRETPATIPERPNTTKKAVAMITASKVAQLIPGESATNTNPSSTQESVNIEDSIQKRHGSMSAKK